MDENWYEKEERVMNVKGMNLSQIVRIADSFKMPYKFQRKGFVGLAVDLSGQILRIEDLSQFR